MIGTEIISGAQKKDKIAMRAIFEDYFSRLKNICTRYAKNNEQGIQFLHSGFYTAFQSIHTFNLEENFEKWLVKSVIKNCILSLKQNEKEYYVTTTVKMNSGEWNKPIQNKKIEIQNFELYTNSKIVESIQALPPSYRAVFNLHIIDGFSLEDTSKLIEINLETCKRNLERARSLFEKNIRLSCSNE